MRGSILILALLVGSTAFADRLNDVALDYHESQKFCRSFTRSIVVVAAKPKVGEFIEASTVPSVIGNAVAVMDRAGHLRLLASGGLMAAAATVTSVAL